MTDITRILSQIESGDPSAADQLLPLVYNELRRLAAQKMAQEKPGQTLQATALVHEAYLRLVEGDTDRHWDSRVHFFAAASEAMRRILVENARHKKSWKAGGELQRVRLEDAAAAIEVTCDDVLDLNEAVELLLREDPQAASVAKLRLFAGLTLEDVAACLGQPTTTTFRQWTYARVSADASPQGRSGTAVARIIHEPEMRPPRVSQ
jgi:RNA polymerase sigma factor (TIGR02999 family)